MNEHTTVGIAYSLMAKVSRFDKKVNNAYDKVANDSSVNFDKPWKEFVKTCGECIDEFEEIYKRILAEKQAGEK